MEISDKDIYEHIIDLASDGVVINMLSVNRKFNDNSYFKKVLEKRYPLLLRFKKDETYRYFYLTVVKYMAILWEKLSVPYIPTPDFNPKYFYEYFYKNYSGTHNFYTAVLHEAVEIGDLKLAQEFINKGALVTHFTYISAGVGGNVNMFKFLLNTRPPKLNQSLHETLKFAKINNNKDLISYLETLGIN